MRAKNAAKRGAFNKNEECPYWVPFNPGKSIGKEKKGNPKYVRVNEKDKKEWFLLFPWWITIAYRSYKIGAV